MTSFRFFHLTGRVPINDDLERVMCLKAGTCGHSFCGWCLLHQGPMFNCMCGLKKTAK